MNESDRIRLRHMLDACREALSFVEGRAKNDVIADRALLLALIKEIEIVGEAAGRISAEWRLSHEEIPWAAIIAVRNRLIHAYFDIDAEVVWSAVTLELPELAQTVEGLLDTQAVPPWRWIESGGNLYIADSISPPEGHPSAAP